LAFSMTKYEWSLRPNLHAFCKKFRTAVLSL
jgi:hypothetical protein